MLLVAYAAFAAVVFMLGKGHVLLIDNKDSEDGSVKAIESMTVSVNGGEPTEYMPGDRDMVKVRGQWHRVAVVVDGRSVEKRITLPVNQDMLLLSIPRLLADVDPAVSPFVPEEPSPSTSGPTDLPAPTDADTTTPGP